MRNPLNAEETLSIHQNREYLFAGQQLPFPHISLKLLEGFVNELKEASVLCFPEIFLFFVSKTLKMVNKNIWQSKYRNHALENWHLLKDKKKKKIEESLIERAFISYVELFF